MNNDQFYQNLPSFSKFSELADSQKYEEVPSDWFVIISDIKGSTVAIDAGRYREVNLIGASSIVVASQAVGELEVPFVFGGDGTTLVVPASVKDTVLAELAGLAYFSRTEYELELRVGCVPISELRAQGFEIKVAKFGLVPTRGLAVFQGGGILQADQWIKSKPELYGYESDTQKLPDLKDLTCRWQPIPSTKGQVVSIIILARGKDKDSVYKEILGLMEQIIGGEMDSACPVQLSGMTYKGIRETLKEEKTLHKGYLNHKFLNTITHVIVSYLAFALRLHPWMKPLHQYANQLDTHSDYRKFDDTLRLVLDLEGHQLKKLQEALEERHQASSLYYGLHAADSALMTCFVGGLNDGEHLHFIDGGNGGYARAALQLKEQIALYPAI